MFPYKAIRAFYGTTSNNSDQSMYIEVLALGPSKLGPGVEGDKFTHRLFGILTKGQVGPGLKMTSCP